VWHGDAFIPIPAAISARRIDRSHCTQNPIQSMGDNGRSQFVQSNRMMQLRHPMGKRRLRTPLASLYKTRTNQLRRLAFAVTTSCRRQANAVAQQRHRTFNILLDAKNGTCWY
jgi:hypothetical protein